MKKSIESSVVFLVFIPFLILFCILSTTTAVKVADFFTDWTELELKGIAEINAAQLEGRMNSVRISVLSVAEILDKIDTGRDDARDEASNAVLSMFTNEFIYNAWLAYEPNAFDGNDALHQDDYPGAPSGRFILSYVFEDGRILVAPDMDETTLDDPQESPWYTAPRDQNRLYVDVDNTNENLYDYGLGDTSVYTLSVVSPLRRDGRVIGCVGADVLFDHMTFGIDERRDASVAIFYPDGRVFYASDISFAEESVDTLNFKQAGLIHQALKEGVSLFIADEFSPFMGVEAFTYFQPIHSEGMGDKSLYLYVASPRSETLGNLWPIITLICGITFMVFAVLLSMYLYASRRIFRPIRKLTLSADAISQGILETEIGAYSDSGDEISMLSNSLRRMVEQFRIYIMRHEQAQVDEALAARIKEAFENSGELEECVSEMARILCRHLGIYKTSIVVCDSRRTALMACCKNGEDNGGLPSDFLYHPQVAGLLSTGQRIVFLNTFGIKEHRITFLDEETVSLCVLPLWKSQNLLGYIIFENNSRRITFQAGTESKMLRISEMLAERLSQGEAHEAAELHEAHAANEAHWVQGEDGNMSSAHPDGGGTVHEACPKADGKPVSWTDLIIERAAGVDGLDVERAIKVMGGMRDVYAQAVRLFARTAPPSVEKIRSLLNEGDAAGFAIEVHGIKSALNNIGAVELGEMARRLELAAKSNDGASYAKETGVFTEALERLVDELSFIEREEASRDRPLGEASALVAVLDSISETMEKYDCLAALEILSGVRDFSFGGETDALLGELERSLEAFDFDGVSVLLEKLRE